MVLINQKSKTAVLSKLSAHSLGHLADLFKQGPILRRGQLNVQMVLRFRHRHLLSAASRRSFSARGRHRGQGQAPASAQKISLRDACKDIGHRWGSVSCSESFYVSVGKQDKAPQFLISNYQSTFGKIAESALVRDALQEPPRSKSAGTAVSKICSVSKDPGRFG